MLLRTPPGVDARRCGWPIATRAQQRQRVASAVVAIDSEVQVGRRAACIAAVADLSDRVAGKYHVARAQAGCPVLEMRVVVALPARSDYPDLAAAEPGVADRCDDAPRRAAHRRAARR